MAFTTADARSQLKRFGRWRTERVLDESERGGPDPVSGVLLLAIASVETDLRNIVSFDGADRGLWQQNDWWFRVWLSQVPGCDSGSYEETYAPEQGGALPKGRVPGLTRGARKAISILRDRFNYAKHNGVAETDRRKFMVSAYNAGPSGALSGYRQRGDSDAFTTGGDYSVRVREREVAIRRALRELGWGR